MKNILITGATGYVGLAFLKILREYDYQIKLLSRREVEGYETTICDFGEGKISDSCLDSIDTVFHLAGCAHDVRNKHEAEKYNKINVASTVNL